jgi:hypothetical protein
MYVDEWEYVPELRWPTNVRLYDQMRTDSQLSGLLTAVMWGIAQLRFVIDPNGARKALVDEVAEDLNLPLLGEDPQPIGRLKGKFSHSKFVVQAMLAAIYGHNFFEQVGQIVDGKWRLRKLAPRPPQTIRQINIDPKGGLVSITQWAPVGWNFQEPQQWQGYIGGPEIPVDNLVAFVFQQEAMSWTGRSMMRDCYKDWIIKDRDLRVEAINHERAGGVPYAEGAQGMTDDELASLNMLMSQFRLGENSGLAVPFGTKVNIARGTGSDVDKTIKRLDESMARRFLLQLVNLAQGGQHVGSYALSETFEDFFLVGQRHIAQWYCDTMIEHVIEDIVDWNYGEDEELAPRITWERTSEDSLGTEQLSQLVHDGVITMDQETENWVRYRARMPKKTEPRPEVTLGGPLQPRENRATAGEVAGEAPGAGAGNKPIPNPAMTSLPSGGAAPTKTTASAGSGERMLPPSSDPAPAHHRWWRRGR